MKIYFSRKFRNFFRVILFLIITILLFTNIDWMLKIVYPFHYREEIMYFSEHYNIDPYLVAAIIRNESRFNPQAISRREARGLMQIAPITGIWASERLEIEDYNEEMLFDPSLNIMIGCWYISFLKREFNHNLPLIIAAYNAGNGNVSRWLEDPRFSKDGKTLHYIPFPETREYLRRVLRDYRRYEIIYKEGNIAIAKYLYRLLVNWLRYKFSL